MMAKDVHNVVSAVANPVVVITAAVWKREYLSDSKKEPYIPACHRLKVISSPLIRNVAK